MTRGAVRRQLICCRLCEWMYELNVIESIVVEIPFCSDNVTGYRL